MSAKIELVLTCIRLGSRNTNLYRFERPEGGSLPPVAPGAHISLHLPGGMERQYSLLHAGENLKAYDIAVKREEDSRGGSRWIHDRLRVGMRLQVSPPRNHFPLDEGAAFSLLIAGGIGITPIYAMAHRLRDLGRPFELHYTVRSRSDAILLDELSQWENVTIRIGEESAGAPFALARIVGDAPADAHIYCCGPNGMLEAFEEAGRASSRSADHMHVEYFEARFEAATDHQFTIELARSQTELVVPAGKTILEVLRDAGIFVSYSCSEGVCGACETTVISGIPDHRDSILSEEERQANATMMVCCSGAKSDKLVLDL
ncbi:ferredoxin-NADP reductase [Altererythrobacter atlanticus]|uniref:Phenoxybenzoate dioxygenase subunit beta n=1 Tax=Croceibacterium atlanticum TaxID=1267766 RepID=A0A0F7KQY6_9SPHN|nr:PDR/VanB family oxidoreductase [Croceibacterium atlanticum]AKH42898.1 Phenoxybenzoate dioxygenase subunit beta [Croceibacterium atlanticum]MBB5731678.1 ferredoxin-NADP reductase [Croceibacterium atlanticum]